MTPERYERVYEVFTRANAVAPSARAALLDALCGEDAELRQMVEQLLSADVDALGPAAGPGAVLRSEFDESQAFGSASGKVASPLVGQRVGSFRISSVIGEGGMGTVYAAEQDYPCRRVALKMIRPGAMSRGLLRRFRFEAEVLGRLQHPGIAQIYEAGEIQMDARPQPYFAMEYVEGVELRQYASEHNLDIRARLALVARVCDAVHHAHQKGIVHRDLKPDNILVVNERATPAADGGTEFTRLGQPKVLDFGVARATDCDVQVTTIQTDAGQIVGTITYMSPEQVAGDSRMLDTRSDVYALGVILYELLSGRPPFQLRRRSIPEAARIIREDEPTRLSSVQTVFRGDIDTIVGKALEKDRERRYQSAGELAADIRRYLAHEPIAAHPPTAIYQLRKFSKRHKGLVAGLALAFVILIAGTVSSLLFGLAAERGKALAQQSEAEARRGKYRLSITAAAEMGDADPVRALRLLESVPPDSRNWEWRHLYARLASHVGVWQADGRDERGGVLACRSDGSLMAALARGGDIELVELASGETVARFGVEGGVSVPSLSPCGRYVAAAAPAEGALVVWDVATQACLFRQAIDAAAFICAQFSQDGALLAILSRKDDPIVIKTTTGKVALRIASKSGCSGPVVFDPLGRRIAIHGVRTTDTPRGSLAVYSLSGDRLAAVSLPEGYDSLAYSPDGTCLAVGTRQQAVRLLDADTLEERRVLYGHTSDVSALAFSPDGALLASASADGSIRLWDTASGRTERVLAAEFSTYRPRSLAISGDGAKLACGNGAEVRLWDLSHHGSSALAGHGTYVYRVTFSPVAGLPWLLASSSYAGETRLWDALSGEVLVEVPLWAPHRLLSFSPDGSRLLVSDHLGSSTLREVLVIDTCAGVEIVAPRTPSDEIFFETPLRPFNASAGGAKMGEGGSAGMVSSLDGSLLAAVVTPNEVRIRDLTTDRTVSRIAMPGVAIRTVAFSPDATRIATGDETAVVRIWDIATGSELAVLEGHSGCVYALSYSPDGTRIASGGSDGAIILWDVSTFEQVLVLRGHASYVASVCFSPDGTMLASGSGDETVRLWDSVTPFERWRQVRDARALRRQAEPLVERLLAEFDDPLDVADQLRRDASMSEDLRRQASILLMRRSRPALADGSGETSHP